MTTLRQRMTEDMQVRNLSPHTQASYLQQVSLFARHFGKSPDVLGPDYIRTYQIYLMNEKKLAPSSIHLAVGALRVLYKVTLKRDWTFEAVPPSSKKAADTARCVEPRRGGALPWMRRLSPASCDLDRVLRRRLADFRSRSLDGHRHRQQADGHPRRARQRPQGSLCHALAEAVGYSARSLAGCTAGDVVVPGHPNRAATLERRRRSRLPEGPPAVRPVQAGDAAFLEARVRRPSARIRHRFANHPAAARSSIDTHHPTVPSAWLCWFVMGANMNRFGIAGPWQKDNGSNNLFIGYWAVSTIVQTYATQVAAEFYHLRMRLRL
jgi:hypothetical protein